MDNKKKFLNNGWVNFGNILDPIRCKEVADQLINSRQWDKTIFRSKKNLYGNKRHLNVTPQKNGYNLAEELNLDFIENNKTLKKYLSLFLGKNYEIMLKKFVVSTPEKIIPKWLNPIVKKKLDGHLAQYIKPEYRNISYFSGIDYHMDILDYADFDADYVTVYIYLTDVIHNQSPLNVIDKSHKFGATHFPHFLKKTSKKNLIRYSMDGINYEKFKTSLLTGKRGSVYLWSALTLHGTVKSTNNKPRVALRYSIKRDKKSKNCLIDKLYKNLNIKLKNKTRTDLKISNSKFLKYIKTQRFLV